MVVKYFSNSPLLSLSISPDKMYCSVSTREDLILIDCLTLQPLESIPLHMMYGISDVAWSKQNNLIGISTETGSIGIINIHSKSSFKTFKLHKRIINKINFSPGNSNILISASQDGEVKLWDLRSHLPLELTLNARCDGARDCCFNPKKQEEIISCYENGAIYVWDIRFSNKNFTKKINAHSSSILSIDVSNSGEFLFSGGIDKTIKVWKTSELRKELKIITTTNPINNVKWRPTTHGINITNDYSRPEDNEVLSTYLSNEKEIKIWKFNRPYIEKCYFKGHSKCSNDCEWINENSFLSCSKDGSLFKFVMEESIALAKELRPCFSAFDVYGTCLFGVCNYSTDTLKEKTSPKECPVVTTVCLMDTDNEENESFVLSAKSTATENPNKENILLDLIEYNAILNLKIGIPENYQMYKFMKTLINYKSIFEKNDKNKTCVNHNKTQANPRRPKSLIIFENKATKPEKTNSLEIYQSENSHVAALAKVSVYTIVSRLLEKPNESLLNIQIKAYLVIILERYLQELSTNKKKFIISSYIELLNRMKIFSIATSVIKHSTFEESSTASQEISSIDLVCSKCNKTIDYVPPRDKLDMSRFFFVSLCKKCKSIDIKCAVCDCFVKGVYAYCDLCFHGGHICHYYTWFHNNNECPAGCGHLCSSTSSLYFL